MQQGEMSVQSASDNGKLRSELTSDSETRRERRRTRRSLTSRSVNRLMLLLTAVFYTYKLFSNIGQIIFFKAADPPIFEKRCA